MKVRQVKGIADLHRRCSRRLPSETRPTSDGIPTIPDPPWTP